MRSHHPLNHSNRRHAPYVLQPRRVASPIPYPIALALKYAPNNQTVTAIAPHSKTNCVAHHSEAYQPPRESIDTSHQLTLQESHDRPISSNKCWPPPFQQSPDASLP
jgi:hypothetical protein